GHLVGPFEVESVLIEHPAVAEAGVIGKPDPVAMEVVKAFVALKDGYEQNEQLRRELIRFSRDRLGAAVAPREIEFIASLPTTRTRKESQPHTHEEDELFYVLSGSLTFTCGEESFSARDGGFVFLPRGVPHRYRIENEEVRLLGFSIPSGFGDHIERTAERIE